MAIFRSDLPRLPAASGRPLGEALEAGEAKIQALREDFKKTELTTFLSDFFHVLSLLKGLV
jgi:hypothetical protein